MEPASALAQIALGAATLMPNAAVEKKPIELHVYLGQWQNNLSKEVTFETVKETRGRETRRPLFSIPVGSTIINERVAIRKNEGLIYANDDFILESCLQLTRQEDVDCNLRLRFARFVSQARENYINIVMSWYLHTRQATASCALFDETYRWDHDEPLKSIHLIINGTLAGETMNHSKITIQQMRFAQVPSLLELTMKVINHLIDEKRISKSSILIPQDKHEMLDKLRFIKDMTKKLPTKAETP